MKNRLLLYFFLLTFSYSFSQTNTLPSSGKVGIGTTSPQSTLDVRGGAITLGYQGAGLPFRLWAGSSGSNNQLRIGTDYAHVGDAAIEIYQNYAGGSQQNPGKVLVNGNFNVGGVFTLENSSNGFPFKMWAGKNSDGSNHFRLGTDLAHVGDAALEIYQNYSGGDQQKPGIVKVNGNLNVGGILTLENNANTLPFKMWTGVNSNGTNHMRLGTDIVHLGDSVIELYQNYGGGNQQNPGKMIVNGDLGIGTTNIPNAYKLAIAGNVIAEEVTVQLQTQWPDFVFKNTYNLPNLAEVEKHIIEKGHLKDIPSAKEVRENGIKLGEMDAKLLQKIEELMLYTIQQQKEIELLKTQLRNSN